MHVVIEPAFGISRAAGANDGDRAAIAKENIPATVTTMKATDGWGILNTVHRLFP